MCGALVDSGSGVSLEPSGQAAVSVPSPGQQHDQRRLRVLHVLQPVLVHARRAALARVRHRRTGARKTTEGLLRCQTGGSSNPIILVLVMAK